MSYPLKKLSEISKLIMGQSPSSDTYNSEKKGLPFYQGKKDFGEIFPTPQVWCSEPIRIVEENDILISVRAPVGPTNLCKETSCIGRGLAGIRVQNIELGYMRYYFKKYESEISKLGKGSTFASITKSDLENLQIPLPPLPTQKAIVQKLDTAFEKIDASIELAQKNLENVEELGKSVLEEVFGESEYEEKSLSEVSEIINGGTPKTGNKDYWDGDICWITPKDMGKMDSRYVGKTSRMISKTGLEKSSARLFPINSVILSSRAPIGHLAVNSVPMCTNQGCKTLVPGEHLETIYLYYFLLNSVKLLNELGSGTTFKELSGSKLKEVKIPLPPLEKQKEIVEYLDKVFEKNAKMKELYKGKLKDLQEMKQSLLKEAFEGRLVSDNI